jgi:hypothetical protein
MEELDIEKPVDTRTAVRIALDVARPCYMLLLR